MQTLPNRPRHCRDDRPHTLAHNRYKHGEGAHEGGQDNDIADMRQG